MHHNLVIEQWTCLVVIINTMRCYSSSFLLLVFYIYLKSCSLSFWYYLALTSSDESLRIWNFWPTSNVQKKSNNCSPHVYTTNAASAVTSNHFTEDGDLNSSNYRLLNNRSSQNSQSAMSELSLDAARIIKWWPIRCTLCWIFVKRRAW